MVYYALLPDPYSKLYFTYQDTLSPKIDIVLNI